MRSNKIGETGGGTRGTGMTTGKAKFLAQPSKMYEKPVKGTGKPKYQNTVKEARIDTKKISTDRIAGKKITKTEATARARKTPNLPKQIDREAKTVKGQRTAKPTTPKVPVKKKAPTKRNLPSDI